MIKRLLIKFANVECGALMLRVTGLARRVLRFGRLAMKAHRALKIFRNILVTIETKRGLCAFVKCRVTLIASLFIFLMGFGQRAGRYQPLNHRLRLRRDQKAQPTNQADRQFLTDANINGPQRHE